MGPSRKRPAQDITSPPGQGPSPRKRPAMQWSQPRRVDLPDSSLQQDGSLGGVSSPGEIQHTVYANLPNDNVLDPRTSPDLRGRPAPQLQAGHVAPVIIPIHNQDGRHTQHDHVTDRGRGRPGGHAFRQPAAPRQGARQAHCVTPDGRRSPLPVPVGRGGGRDSRASVMSHHSQISTLSRDSHTPDGSHASLDSESVHACGDAPLPVAVLGHLITLWRVWRYLQRNHWMLRLWTPPRE